MILIWHSLWCASHTFSTWFEAHLYRWQKRLHFIWSNEIQYPPEMKWKKSFSIHSHEIDRRTCPSEYILKRRLSTHRFRSRVNFGWTISRLDNSGVCCIFSSVVALPALTHVVDELAGMGTTIDETASNPRDNFNISAPNWWSAVIVDGVGSGMLFTMEIKTKTKEFHLIKMKLIA